MLLEAPFGMYGRLAAALLAGGAFAFWVHRLRLLTPAGALLAGGLGASIIGMGGTAWAVPALLFFGSSALLSRGASGASSASGSHAAPGADRNVLQVLANGGVAWGLLLTATLTGAQLCYWGFVGAFAAAAGDTWATEIGSRFGGSPRSLRTLRPVEAGTSGAMSREGTLAALGGAALVGVGTGPFASAFLAPEASAVAAVLVVAGAGWVGAFADSLAGAYGQARYQEEQTGRLTESAGPGRRHVRGLAWLTNDVVNVLCTLAGAAAAMGGVAGL